MFTNIYCTSAPKKPLKLSFRRSGGRKILRWANRQDFCTAGGACFGICTAPRLNVVIHANTRLKRKRSTTTDLCRQAMEWMELRTWVSGTFTQRSNLWPWFLITLELWTSTKPAGPNTRKWGYTRRSDGTRIFPCMTKILYFVVLKLIICLKF